MILHETDKTHKQNKTFQSLSWARFPIQNLKA